MKAEPNTRVIDILYPLALAGEFVGGRLSEPRPQSWCML